MTEQNETQGNAMPAPVPASPDDCLANHQSAKTTKLLLIGDSGTGKSGALASLAGAGYNLRIIDLDNGIDTIANILRDPKSRYGAEALGRVRYRTFTDEVVGINGKPVVRNATVWPKTIKLLENWPGLGHLSKWTEQDVLVIDSLSFLSKAAMNWQLALNKRLGETPWQSDWRDAGGLVEGLLGMLYDKSIVCNVVITAHIDFIDDAGGQMTTRTEGDGKIKQVPKQSGFPRTLGKSLPQRVGSYFNTMLRARLTPDGKRVIMTVPEDGIALKNTDPARVAKSYPIETGLADYFKVVRGG